MDAYHNPDVFGLMGKRIAEAIGQGVEVADDFVTGVGEGALDAAGPDIVNATKKITGQKPNNAPFYPPHPSSVAGKAGKTVGGWWGRQVINPIVGTIGSDDPWDVADAIGEATKPVFEAGRRAVAGVGRAGRELVDGLVPRSAYRRAAPPPRQRR